eukprot:Sspe_Gene.91891::Locus_63539_Transcript_1_1_Confidence_1.000_Length_1306::g.91891::m.91891/K06999/K06999; phospholipase/carboxylesterase
MDPATMTAKQLKEVITQAGLSYNDCLEMSDLRERAVEALKRGPATPAPPPSTSSSSPSSETATISGWECTILRPSPSPKLAVIFFHGFGATSSDFVPLAEMVKQLPWGKDIAWVFPQAPVCQKLGAAAWWEINLMQWLVASRMGEKDMGQLIREKPNGMEQARVQGTKLVAEVAKRFGVSQDRIVLGGFSQGAITAADVALALPEGGCGGIVMISGAPMVVDEWAEKLKSRPPVDVFISHGRADQVLPYVASEWARDLFKQCGKGKVEHHPHSGG